MAKLTEVLISNMQAKELEKVFGATFKQKANRTQNKEKESRHVKKKTNAENSKKENNENLKKILTQFLLMNGLKPSQLSLPQKTKYAIANFENNLLVYCKWGQKELKISTKQFPGFQVNFLIILSIFYLSFFIEN